MSSAAELIAELRTAMATTGGACVSAASVRDQVDGLIEKIRIATDGSSDPRPGEAMARWQTGQIRLDEAIAGFRAAQAAIEEYIAKGLGGDTGGAGSWKDPPGKRHHDSPKKTTEPTFNADYERWVRTVNGGPEGDREYYVENHGERAYFDAVRTYVKDGKTVEVFIDAKGKYDQFIDPRNPGRFQKWWEESTKSGLSAMMETAERQVRIAGDRQVEWWCAEPKSARAFNRALRRNRVLSGKARAIYKPMLNDEQ